MMSQSAVEERNQVTRADRLIYWTSLYWLPLFALFWGIFVLLPWLAPFFMKIGWTPIGNALYLLYTPLCHQLPQRSFFLFGAEPMYSLAEVQAAWQVTYNPLILRQFVGNEMMGWKVAWSDRMASMYGAILLWGLIYWPLRHRVKAAPLWLFILLLVPMAIDGGTHVISDFTSMSQGLGYGFRDHNAWLITLTNNAFPATFYAGDALGSFNSLMRLMSGLLFGLGVVWLLFPHLERGFMLTVRQIEYKMQA